MIGMLLISNSDCKHDEQDSPKLHINKHRLSQFLSNWTRSAKVGFCNDFVFRMDTDIGTTGVLRERLVRLRCVHDFG